MKNFAVIKSTGKPRLTVGRCTDDALLLQRQSAGDILIELPPSPQAPRQWRPSDFEVDGGGVLRMKQTGKPIGTLIKG